MTSPLELVYIQCPECKQEAPVINGGYDLIHDKDCSRGRLEHKPSLPLP